MKISNQLILFHTSTARYGGRCPVTGCEEPADDIVPEGVMLAFAAEAV